MLNVATKTLQDDPIYAAIERHRAANASCAREDDLADAEADSICNLEIAALDQLDKTAPTTLAGLSAYLLYRAEIERRFETEGEIHTNVSWLLLRKAGQALAGLLKAA